MDQCATVLLKQAESSLLYVYWTGGSIQCVVIQLTTAYEQVAVSDVSLYIIFLNRAFTSRSKCCIKSVPIIVYDLSVTMNRRRKAWYEPRFRMKG